MLVDGSSTVFPVTEAIAEEFQLAGQRVRVTVGVSGTGGGFSKFCNGEIDLTNASRPIKDSEAEVCEANGVRYVELAIAIDAIAVVVNPQDGFVPNDCLTVEQLRETWEPGSSVRRWSDLDPSLPDVALKLYSPGHDSGTFDYFTEAVMGESGASRTEGVLFSEDDNVLVQGVAGDRGSFGYFGLAYYEENADKLKALAIDAGDGCVPPTAEAIEADRYRPLSRPLFIYVKQEALRRPEVEEFTRFYLEHVDEVLDEIGYVPLPRERYESSVRAFREALR